MKNVMLTTICLVTLLFVSCGDDDDATGTTEKRYVVNSVVLPEANRFDFNGDGEISENLIDEINCYGNSEITLVTETTFEMTLSIADDFNAGGADAAGCEVDTLNGTYTLDGEDLLLTYEDETTAMRLEGDKIIHVFNLDEDIDIGFDLSLTFTYELVQ